MLIQLMPQGRQALIDAGNSNNAAVGLSSYSIGDAYGFAPDLNQLDVLPSPNFSGTNHEIYKTIVTPHEIIFTVYLPYYLDIIVGNIMVKTSQGLPFLWMIMDQKFQKGVLNEDKHFAGDTYYQSMILRFPNIISRLDLSNIADFYSSAKVFSDYFSLPQAITIEEDQFVLENGTHFVTNNGRMVYGTQVFNKQWAVPLMQSINDEDIGIFRGGVVGDGYYYDK